MAKLGAIYKLSFSLLKTLNKFIGSHQALLGAWFNGLTCTDPFYEAGHIQNHLNTLVRDIAMVESIDYGVNRLTTF